MEHFHPAVPNESNHSGLLFLSASLFFLSVKQPNMTRNSVQRPENKLGMFHMVFPSSALEQTAEVPPAGRQEQEEPNTGVKCKLLTACLTD